MSNQFQVIGMVTQKALARFINTLGFTLQVSNPYQKEFGVSGAKIGNNLNIRLPVNFIGGFGPTINPEDIVEQVTPLTISAQINVSFLAYTSEELLYMDDHMERYVYPAVETLADKFDRLGLALFNQGYNGGGVPGQSIAALYTAAGAGVAGQKAVQDLFLNAGASMSDQTAPISDRVVILNPQQEASTVSALTNIFNPGDTIGMQYKSARMKNGLGFDFGMDQNIPIFITGGSTTAVTVNGAAQTGNTLNVSGLTGTVNPGDVLIVSTGTAVNGVNPKNYQGLLTLQRFTVTASVTGTGGNNAIPITPPINPALGVGQTVTASPDNAATVVFNPNASNVSVGIGVKSPTAFIFHPSAFTWAAPELPLINKGVVEAYRATDKQTGLSSRAITSYDAVHDQLVTRFDLLASWALIRPQWFYRLQS